MLVKILRCAGIALALMCCWVFSYAQGSTSKGTEFWTAFMFHADAPPASTMVLYITSDVSTTGAVQFTNGAATQNFTVTANQVTILKMPSSSFLGNYGKFTNAIHITAAAPIAVYGHIFASDASGATLLLPVAALGKDYYSINYTQNGNVGTYSTFMVIGTEDNTTVQITPTQKLLDNHAPKQPYTITLNKGQVYQAFSAVDLTGTRIQSISSGTNSCQKIAVYSGSGRVAIGCGPNNSSDNLFQQVYPTVTWGKNYVTVPLKNRKYDVFRIVLSTPNTNVLLNGVAVPNASFVNGLYYEFGSKIPNAISADQPIQVVQYAVSQGNTIDCKTDTSDVGDPEMIYLPPLEQTLNNVTLYSPLNYLILSEYINIVIKTKAVLKVTPQGGLAPNLLIDGIGHAGFLPIPNTAYSYLQLPVSSGTHTLASDSGFSVVAYGFGQYESYGYAGGVNLQDLNSSITLQDPQTNSSQPNGCSNSPYNLQLTLPYQTTSIKWDFQNGTPPLQESNPTLAGTTVKGGQILYEYNYPKNPVNFTKGNYSLAATVFNPGSDPCGSTAEIDYNFNISDPPVAAFDDNDFFLGDATVFADASSSDAPITQWYWDFGDGNSSDLQNPSNTYAKAGKYNVNLTVTDADGCTSNSERPLTIIPKPIAIGPVTGIISACSGTASSSPNLQQFTVTGSGLTAGIVLTAPAGFELSLTQGSGFVSTLTLPQSGGSVPATTIYVRASSTAAQGTVTSSINVTSKGQNPVLVPVTESVNPVPSINTVQGVSYKNGDTTQPIDFSGVSSGFTWTNDNPAIGLPASGTGSIPSFKAINTSQTGSITANITAYPQSQGIAFIANFGSNNVSEINIKSNAVTNTIPVKDGPYGMAVDPARGLVYVANSNSNNISVISASSATVVSTISAVNPHGIVLNADGSKLYVSNYDANTLSVIDATNGSLIATIPVGKFPVGVAITNDGTQVYVANSNSATISVISTATNQVTNTLQIGNQPLSLAISPDGSELYVSNYNINTDVGIVSVFSTATNQVTANIAVGLLPFGIAISPDGKRIYVANEKSNTISVIDATSNQLINTIKVGQSPWTVSLSPDGGTAYVANNLSNNVSVINTSLGTVSATIAVGINPISLGNSVIAGSGCSGSPAVFKITVTPTIPTTLTEIGTPTALTTTYGTPSASSSITVSGTLITGGILVTPPGGFEVSTDGKNFAATVTVAGSGTIAATTVYIRLAATTPVGSYSGTITLSTANATDVPVTMPISTVTQAPLTIKADDKSKQLNTANPPLTITYTGFVNKDNSSQLTTLPQISTTATTASPIGTYPITVGGAAAVNYSLTYLQGILTVTPALTNASIPNTFTPNGDGINDVWDIKYLEYFPRCTVNIYNRYGEKVFSSIGYTIPWDGRYKGSVLPTGAYYYIIDLKNGDGLISGWVAIVK